jgi:DNA-binding response OmpR family regulator
MRLLIVEDHEELAMTLATGLRREGMAVDVAHDGESGVQRAVLDDYDVIVLDRDLPGLHGDLVCGRLLAAGCRARVLMLTAAGTIEDRVDGLTLGADDYLSKPFAFAELVARIRALTPKELGVLEVLLGADGAVVSAEELLTRIWDEQADPFSNVVKVTISRLRAKLGDPPAIETVPTAGYRI